MNLVFVVIRITGTHWARQRYLHVFFFRVFNPELKYRLVFFFRKSADGDDLFLYSSRTVVSRLRFSPVFIVIH